jgi:hypothetical protein
MNVKLFSVSISVKTCEGAITSDKYKADRKYVLNATFFARTAYSNNTNTPEGLERYSVRKKTL